MSRVSPFLLGDGWNCPHLHHWGEALRLNRPCSAMPSEKGASTDTKHSLGLLAVSIITPSTELFTRFSWSATCENLKPRSIAAHALRICDLYIERGRYFSHLRLSFLLLGCDMVPIEKAWHLELFQTGSHIFQRCGYLHLSSHCTRCIDLAPRMGWICTSICDFPSVFSFIHLCLQAFTCEAYNKI